MKQSDTKKRKPAQTPFAKRMATIVFEANVPHKSNAMATIGLNDFPLSATDRDTYAKLQKHFFRVGENVVSKSAQDIANIMPPEVFMNALPGLTKARAISVTFWEHAAASPKFWRKVKSF